MIPQFEGLNEAEKELMYDAIPLITIYIAGADGDIKQEETEWAEKVTKIRSYTYDNHLGDYYSDISANYSDKLTHYLNTLPHNVEARTNAIGEKLAALNPIFAKLDNNIAARLYKDFVSFAKHVAKAAGGFLGIGSISREEKKLIGLDMIIPVHLEVSEEEENDEA